MKIKQTAKEITSVTGPVTITGTTVTAQDGTVVATVGIDETKTTAKTADK